MTREKALSILKQPDRIGCHLIKANDEESNKFNYESLEAQNMAIESLNKLAQIEQIINEYNNGNDMEYKYLDRIREVLEYE